MNNIDYQYILEFDKIISGTKIHNFNISKLYSKLKSLDNEKKELAYRLIDVKLYACFCWSIMFKEYSGLFKIAGNNDLLEITPEALYKINGLSYRISILSILIEKLLDLLDYTFNGSVTDYKKGKWQKKLYTISNHLTISEEKQISFRFQKYL